jgi:beta-lactamase regulating signal transducer with metallopeptidase domain
MHVIAQSAAQGIISCLILGLLVAAVAWSLTKILPAGSAALRFGVWFSALALIGLTPILQSVLQAHGNQSASATASAQGLLVLPVRYAWYLFATWAVVAFAGLVRVLIGAWHVAGLRSRSSLIEPSSLDPMVQEAIQHAAIRRAFEVRESAEVNVPLAIGFFHPAVIFPEGLLQQLTAQQLKQVVLHETTHLLRYDDWTNLLQKLIGAALFFHPAVWWLENRLSLEREMACDEAVVAETKDPRSYAECLAALAERSMLGRSIALVQAAVSRLRHTSLRVKQLLMMENGKRVHGWGSAITVVGVISCAAVLVQAPELVSFQKSGIAARQEAVLSVGQVPRVVPASFVSESPRVIPANLTQATANRHVLSTKTQHTSSRANALARVSDHRGVSLASQSQAEAIPVLLRTTMLVESDGSAGQQVWLVQVWRVAMYYPAAQHSQSQSSRKI